MTMPPNQELEPIPKAFARHGGQAEQATLAGVPPHFS
jgi:hypothetical protein